MKTARFLSALLALALCRPLFAAAPALPENPRVFVCAHSFMIFTAQMLPPVTKAAQIEFRGAGQQMIGGSRVIQHWDLPDDRNRAKAALREGKVDVLTLSPHLMLPDPGIDNFVKLGVEKNPNLRVLVQASWPPRDGALERSFANEDRDKATVESLHKVRGHFEELWLTKLEAQVRALNRTLGRETVFIVPAGAAVFALREQVAQGKVPGIAKQSELFRDPLGHPQPALAALVTYCHFAAIYQRSPVGLPLPPEFAAAPHAAELNPLLQQIAWDAVSSYPMSGVKSESAAGQ